MTITSRVQKAQQQKEIQEQGKETEPTSPDGASELVEPGPEPKEYQQYKCTRQSQRLITTKGVPITFSGFEFITKNKDIIAYLDKEIGKAGLPGISKGKMLSSSERNPMEALKAKHFAEFENMKTQERAALANGIMQNMGNTNPVQGRINPVTSSQVASAS